MRGAANDVILDLLRQLDKEGAVTRHAHHQPGEILRALLCFAQCVGIYHVKLDVLELELGKCPQKIRQLA